MIGYNLQGVMAMRLSDINNKKISVTLTDFELAKPEDNTPEKLAERAMDDKKESDIIAYAAYNGIKDIITKSCTIIINVDANGDAEYEYIDNSVPTNPETGKPYFETRDDAWDGEWVAGEAKPIPNSEQGGDDE